MAACSNRRHTRSGLRRWTESPRLRTHKGNKRAVRRIKNKLIPSAPNWYRIPNAGIQSRLSSRTKPPRTEEESYAQKAQAATESSTSPPKKARVFSVPFEEPGTKTKAIASTTGKNIKNDRQGKPATSMHAPSKQKCQTHHEHSERRKRHEGVELNVAVLENAYARACGERQVGHRVDQPVDEEHVHDSP